MAVTIPANQTIVSTEERTWRATLETPKGQPYYLDLHRERCSLDAEGKQVGERRIVPAIHLMFNDIAGDEVAVPVNGTKVTMKVADLCAFLIKYFDDKATELSNNAAR